MARVVGRSGRSPDFDDNIDNAGGDNDGELCWGRSPIWPSADCEGSEAKFCGWLDLSGSCEIQNIGCWFIRLFIWRPILRLARSMAQSRKRDPMGPSRGWTLPIIDQFDKLWKWQLSRLCIYCLFFSSQAILYFFYHLKLVLTSCMSFFSVFNTYFFQCVYIAVPLYCVNRILDTGYKERDHLTNKSPPCNISCGRGTDPTRPKSSGCSRSGIHT